MSEVLAAKRKLWPDLERTEREEMRRLWLTVWPEAETRIEELAKAWSHSIEPGSCFHLVRAGDQLVALARSFERQIAFPEDGCTMKVMALAGVCCHPDNRARGFGKAVVSDAFERVDSGEYAVSLFQTGIPAFYEKLGSKKVANRFVDSTNIERPEENPWWNDFQMVYPSSAKWSDRLTVDLLGPAY